MSTKNIKMTQKGFTLIELMIVVAIIGVLASIALPAFGKFQCRGNYSAALSEVKSTLNTTAADNAASNTVSYSVTDSSTKGDVTVTGTLTGSSAANSLTFDPADSAAACP